MYGVDLYGLVRRMVMRDGVSHREAARRFGIDRGTVAKMVKVRSMLASRCRERTPPCWCSRQ